MRRLVADALSGGTTEGDLSLVTRAGRRLAFHADLLVEGSGRSRALVMVAREPSESPGATPAAYDCACDVSRPPAGHGRVIGLSFLDAQQNPSAWLGRPLAAFLEAIGAKAALAAANDVIESRAAESVRVLLPDADNTFRVVTVRLVDAETVRVTVRCIDASLLPDLVDAKIARVAEANGLSDRERQVLRLLLRGRGVEDIATMLEIAPRTVKFHQANVLQKLAADSRLDLLRVVL
jgi:DNA-binding CsgD family transcriptional regulator